RRRHRQAGRVHLQERDHARLVGGDDLGDEPLPAAGDGDEDGGGLVGEVEGGGDDVAVGGDDEAGGGADALTHLGAGAGADDGGFGAAGGFDLHDRRGDVCGRRAQGLLVGVVDGVGGLVGERRGGGREAGDG